MAAISGAVLVILGTLSNTSSEFHQVDKLLHFSSYAILGALFILSLKPIYWIPSFFFLFLAGFTLEYLQIFVGRDFQMSDFYSNNIGICIGVTLGFLIRVIFGFIRNELALLAERRNTIYVPEGQAIFRQNDPSEFLYIVKKGYIRLHRTVGSKKIDLGFVSPGEVFGEVGVIKRSPRYATAIAEGYCELLAMKRSELLAQPGGRKHPAIPVLHMVVKRLCSADEFIENHLLAKTTEENEDHIKSDDELTVQ